MTDRKKGIKPFFDGFAPPAKKVITADFEVNEVRANDMSEQKKKSKAHWKTYVIRQQN